MQVPVCFSYTTGVQDAKAWRRLKAQNPNPTIKGWI